MLPDTGVAQWISSICSPESDRGEEPGLSHAVQKNEQVDRSGSVTGSRHHRVDFFCIDASIIRPKVGSFQLSPEADAHPGRILVVVVEQPPDPAGQIIHVNGNSFRHRGQLTLEGQRKECFFAAEVGVNETDIGYRARSDPIDASARQSAFGEFDGRSRQNTFLGGFGVSLHRSIVAKRLLT